MSERETLRTLDGLELVENMQVFWVGFNDYIETGRVMLSQQLLSYGCSYTTLNRIGNRYWSTEALAKLEKASILRTRAKSLIREAKQLEYEGKTPSDLSAIFY